MFSKSLPFLHWLCESEVKERISEFSYDGLELWGRVLPRSSLICSYFWCLRLVGAKVRGFQCLVDWW